jgi:hypothetical protein
VNSDILENDVSDPLRFVKGSSSRMNTNGITSDALGVAGIVGGDVPVQIEIAEPDIFDNIPTGFGAEDDIPSPVTPELGISYDHIANVALISFDPYTIVIPSKKQILHHDIGGTVPNRIIINDGARDDFDIPQADTPAACADGGPPALPKNYPVDNHGIVGILSDHAEWAAGRTFEMGPC